VAARAQLHVLLALVADLAQPPRPLERVQLAVVVIDDAAATAADTAADADTVDASVAVTDAGVNADVNDGGDGGGGVAGTARLSWWRWRLCWRWGLCWRLC
jgi:hypothetical protein